MDKMSQMPGREIKAVITLLGNSNSGKTATLRYLYYLLSNKMPPLGKKYKDFRECFKYKDVIISMSTVGDTEEEVEMNWIFFRHKWKKDFSDLNIKIIHRSQEDLKDEVGKVKVVI